MLVELSVGIGERMAVGSIDWLGDQCRKVLYIKIKILLLFFFDISITIIFGFFLIKQSYVNQMHSNYKKGNFKALSSEDV